ncbi:MAG: hypothetical protein AAGC55_16040, partial [Myxococcota bacterium]
SRPQYLSLILPTLGDLDSLTDLPALSEAAIRRVNLLWSFSGGEERDPAVVDNRARALSAVRQMLDGQDLEPPVTADDLLERFRLSDLNQDNDDTKHGDFAAGVDAVTLIWRNARLRRVSIYSLLDNYCATYGLHLVPELIAMFKQLNPNLANRGSKSNFSVQVADTFQFPLPGEISKLKKTAGGFQSLGAKTLSADKVGELANRRV